MEEPWRDMIGLWAGQGDDGKETMTKSKNWRDETTRPDLIAKMSDSTSRTANRKAGAICWMRSMQDDHLESLCSA